MPRIIRLEGDPKRYIWTGDYSGYYTLVGYVCQAIWLTALIVVVVICLCFGAYVLAIGSLPTTDSPTQAIYVLLGFIAWAALVIYTVNHEANLPIEQLRLAAGQESGAETLAGA